MMSSMRTRCVVVVALALASATSTDARAQAPPDRARIQAADEAFTRGQAALEAGRLDEACSAFEESLRLDVGVGALLNLARCHRLQGKILQAHREYGEAADLATRAGQTERAEAARAVVQELAAVLPRLRIEIGEPTPGLAIAVDGAPIDPATVGDPIAIEVGPHTVEATAPGRAPWRSTVEVSAAPAPRVVRVPRLVSPSAPAPPAGDEGDDALVTTGLIVGGVGVVGLVVGSIFGVMTLSDASTARDDPALCPDDLCTEAGRAHIDAAETKGVVSTVALGVGAAAVVAGVVLVVVGLPGDDATTSSRLAPTAGPGDAGLGASIRF